MPHPLLGLQFPEESSDDEYDPTTENTKDTDVRVGMGGQWGGRKY